jgi:lysophospholipase L1-like esterase
MTDRIAEDAATRDLLRAGELLANAPWKRFAVLGDSAAAGIREVVDGYPDKSWFDWIAECLSLAQPELAARNFARKGALTREVRSEQLAPALAFRPDLAVVLCGGNDLLRGSFGGVAEEYDAIVGELGNHGANVVTMSLFDITRTALVPERLVPSLRQGLDRLAATVRGVAERHGCVHLDFGVHPSSAEASIYASDGQHLTTRGQAVVAAELVCRLGAL